ncbi:peptidylprolyl isomerase [Actinospica durhamensis]|uniref:Peptidylprolyl isomerase n=1 Tax=Actinospica durhamensis TaxID=1508375 RepID=A0A941EJF8_9ACTN|nr:peptidylprolyl isomerase [Actinospica durhamensis]MBR7832667.1 peptidylprolyl isomerase [Actinospica durhamensis]
MASTKDRQRALERARYERVQGKIQQKRRETQRRRRIAIVSTVAAVVVAGGLVAAFAIPSSNNSTKTAASTSTASASASASASSTAAANPLAYEASGTAAKSGIAVPTYNAADAEKTYTVTLATNRGDIVISMDGKAAPYTVYSFVYLAQKGYFDNTKCHRLVWASGLFMLQCGDPTGTGQGGPGYTIPDENLASLGAAGSSGTVTYKTGVVAMANTGAAHTGGSQFFLVGEDSTLAPTYTPFGTITKGLDILQSIGKAGAAAADSNGNTPPKDATTIEKVTIQAS